MPETEHFVNEGYGWVCRRCRDADDAAGATCDTESSPGADALPRFFREGEAEEREPRLSENALARWKDDSRLTILCPRCGVEEDISE
ncbi:MAG: hypothetical protein DMF67_02795 [Acidobacteria bacterium]|nr:MAG: hypothetical protein DMF67_02795 [Acidobacteriota bacterium]